MALVVIAGALTIAIALLFFSVEGQAGVNVRLELAKGGISLLGAFVITGAVAQMLNSRAQQRADARETLEGLVRVRRELKVAYEQMAIARMHLIASCTALTFIDQLDRLADCRIRLQRLQRQPVLLTIPSNALQEQLTAMVKFTKGPSKIYKHAYRDLYTMALIEKRNRDKFLTDSGLAALETPPVLDPSTCQPADCSFLTDITGDQPGLERCL